ncbi:MAG: hypothetical protein WCV59_03730 [Parcubacteria group bacterium]|jgi:hypothetical protein
MSEKKQDINEKDRITTLIAQTGAVKRFSDEEKAEILLFAVRLGAEKAEETGNPGLATVIRKLVTLTPNGETKVGDGDDEDR